MSLEKVGHEILPNCHIKRIEIYDESDLEYAIKVNVCVMDHIFPNGKRKWSSSAMSEHLKILFLFSKSPTLNSNIKEAGFDFKPSSFRPYMEPDGITKHYEKKIFGDKMYRMQSTLYYHNTFEFKILKTKARNLEIFCSVYLDENATSRDMNFFSRKTNISYRGPVTSEKIFDTNGKLVDKSSIFIKSTGQQYFGPVHLHPDKGYMAGSHHSSSPHHSLSEKKIFNYKIKDYRKKDLKRHSMEQNKYSIVSDLITSFNGDKNISAMFALNTKSLVLNETKYGHLLNNTMAMDEIVSKMRIKSFSIFRHRVNTNINTNKIGSKIVTHSDLSKKLVASSADSKGDSVPFLDTKEIMVSNKPHSQQQRYDKSDTAPRKNISAERYSIKNPAGLNVTQDAQNKTAEFAIKDKSNYKDAFKLRQINLNVGSDLRYYEFSDHEINNRSPGSYKYSLMLAFRDPTMEYIKHLTNRLSNAETIITHYYNRMARKRFYNYDMDEPNNAFKEDYLGAATQVGTPGGSSPWRGVIDLYIEVVSIMFDLTDNEKEKLIFQSLNRLHPSTAYLKSVSSFIDDFNSLLSYFYKYFDIPKDGFNAHSQKTVPRKTHSTNMIITKEYHFLSSFTPKHYKETYKLMTFDSDSSGLPKMNFSSYQRRLTRENNKFYKKPKRRKTDLKYFTPLSIVADKEEIPLEDISSDDVIKINSFFDNRVLLQDNTVSNSQNKLLSDQTNNLFFSQTSEDDELIALQEEEQLEKYVVSKEYLGQAIDYSEEEMDYKVSNEHENKGTLFYNNILNSVNRKKSKFNKFSFDKSSPNSILSKAKKRLNKRSYEAFVENIPAPIKVLFDSQDKDVKNNYHNSQEDPYSSPNTSDIININHYKIAKIEYFIGFDQANENLLLSKPLFAPIDEGFFNRTGAYLCKMSWFSDNYLEIDANDHLSMPISNSYFIIHTDEENLYGASREYPQTYTQNLTRKYEGKISFYDMDGIVSNIVSQFENDFVKMTPPQTKRITDPIKENMPIPSMGTSTPSTSTTGGDTSGGMGGTGGGGYSGGGGTGGGY